MAHRGHVPFRACAGCGRRVAKGELVRFTVGKQGDDRPVLDEPGRAGGRGAYLCPQLECLEKALKRKSLSRRLRAGGENPDLKEDFLRLLEERAASGKR